jgi:ATP-dependent DNA helicase RecG
LKTSVADDIALRRLGVLVPVADSGRLVPSLAGLLSLGTYPQQFFPQLNVTFVVFPTDHAGVVPDGGPRFIDNRSLNGPIPWIVSDAVDAITRNMRISGRSGASAGRTLTSTRSRRCARQS